MLASDSCHLIVNKKKKFDAQKIFGHSRVSLAFLSSFSLNIYLFIQIVKLRYIPDTSAARYATFWGVTSNLSFCCVLATMSSNIESILVVRDTVTWLGCLKPLMRCPTRAKWKLLVKDRPTEWSSWLKYHFKGSLVFSMTVSRAESASPTKVPWLSRVKRFCSSSARPEAYKEISSNWRDMPGLVNNTIFFGWLSLAFKDQQRFELSPCFQRCHLRTP